MEKNKIKYFVGLTYICIIFFIIFIFSVKHFLLKEKYNSLNQKGEIIELLLNNNFELKNIIEELEKNNSKILVYDLKKQLIFGQDYKIYLENDLNEILKNDYAKNIIKIEGSRKIYIGEKINNYIFIIFDDFGIKEIVFNNLTFIFFIFLNVIIFFFNFFYNNFLKQTKNFYGKKVSLIKIDNIIEENNLDNQINNINNYIELLKIQNYNTENILSSMSEGIVLLDKDKNIFLANKSSIEILGLNKDYNKINILHLIRDLELKKAINRTKNLKENQFVDIKKDDKILRFIISFTKEESFVIIIYDNTKIKKLENMRKEFTSNITHELKTPLTSISGFAELISIGIVKDKKEIIYYNEKILEESKRLINLVENILKLSYIEKGIIKEDEIYINLEEVFEYAFNILQNQIKEKDIKIKVTRNIILKFSKTHIYELIFNLVDNSIKYNVNNGFLNIEMFEDKNNKGFKISNSGNLIPEKDIDRIFERFYRVDKSRKRETGGTGLGLSIVKHIVELNNGTINVTSDCDKTEFIIYFPIRK